MNKYIFKGLQITAEGIIKRDEFIFQQCLTKSIPILMVLSGEFYSINFKIIFIFFEIGGYQLENAEIISNSIKNIYSKFNLHSRLEFFDKS